MSRQHRWSLFMGSLKQKGKWTFSRSALAVSVTLLQTLIGMFDVLPRKSWPGNEPRQTGIDLRCDQQPAPSAWSQRQVGVELAERPPSGQWDIGDDGCQKTSCACLSTVSLGTWIMFPDYFCSPIFMARMLKMLPFSFMEKTKKDKLRFFCCCCFCHYWHSTKGDEEAFFSN